MSYLVPLFARLHYVRTNYGCTVAVRNMYVPGTSGRIILLFCRTVLRRSVLYLAVLWRHFLRTASCSAVCTTLLRRRTHKYDAPLKCRSCRTTTRVTVVINISFLGPNL